MTLLGAAQVIRELIDVAMNPAERAEYDRVVAVLRANVNENKSKHLWDAGWAMNIEQAIKYALDQTHE